MIDVKPDTHLDNVLLRHKTDEKRLAELREELKDGWNGRPLLVIKNRENYEVITGCHRASVAMEFGFRIPVVIIPEDALTAKEKNGVLNGGIPYFTTMAEFFAKRGLNKAAELMRQEQPHEPAKPTVKPATQSKTFRMRLASDDPPKDAVPDHPPLNATPNGESSIASPLLKNYRFFALAYLNDWWQYDSRFFNGLQTSNNRKIRLYWLREAAAYYQVIRNFAEKYDQGERMGKALDALDELEGPITSDNVDTNVNRLAGLLKSAYKQTLQSAASKFLWIRFRSPIIIYDERARRGLKLAAKINRLGSGYGKYRKAWLKLFEKEKTAINSAHDGLSTLKDCAPSDKDAAQLDSLLRSPWFHERVFDKYLWWNGRSGEVPK